MAENNKKIEEAQKKLVSDSEYYTMLGKTAFLVAFRLSKVNSTFNVTSTCGFKRNCLLTVFVLQWMTITCLKILFVLLLPSLVGLVFWRCC